MTYKVIDLPQGSNEWLEFRKNKIGGSDIPSIMDLAGAFKSRKELLEEKLTGKSKEVTEFQKSIFERGHELEAIARARIEKHLGHNFPPLVIQSTTNESFMASLDGFNVERGEVLEIKSTKNKEKLEQANREEVTDIFGVQLQWQMMLSGAKRGYLAVINSEDETELHLIEQVPNEEKQQEILAAVAKFIADKSKAVAPITDLQSTTLDYIERSKRVIAEYQKLIDLEEDKIKEMAAKVLDEYKAEKIKGGNVTIEWATRKGNIDYGRIPQLENVDLEPFRKPASRFVKITVKGEKSD